MEVEATIESPIVFAGDQVAMTVEFIPPPAASTRSTPVLLSGYAAVQGSFRLGEMILSEPFAETRKAGTVLTKRGFDYGQPQSNGGLFAGMLDGLRHLVVAGANSTSGVAGGMAGGSSSSTNGARGDEGEYPIYATSQLLLFTDLKLEPNQPSHKFRFVVDLPPNLPPTYRSRSLHISYNLVVGFERLKQDGNNTVSATSLGPQDTRLFLPFRLLARPPTASLPTPLKFDLREPFNAPPPQLTNNEDLEMCGDKEHADCKEKSGDMDAFIENLLNGDISERLARNSSSMANVPGAQYTKVSYDINRGRTPIAQLVLARPAIAVGDVMAAQIRFKRPCLHLSVYLELEEVIEEQYAALGGPHMHLIKQQGVKNSSDPNRTARNGSLPGQDDESSPLNGSRTNSLSRSNTPSRTASPMSVSEEVVATTYTIYGRQFQGVYGLSELPVFLPTLTSVTPRLDTEQMTASWTLRIEFVGLAGSAFSDDDDNELLAKGQIDHETFTCRIPVVVLPPMSGGLCASKTWRF